MNEDYGDLWSYIGQVDIIFITTNLAQKRGGLAVMGRGCALEALKRWPKINQVLGSHITQGRHTPAPLWKIHPRTELWSFPVKEKGFLARSEEELDDRVVSYQRQNFRPGQYVPSWAQRATLARIEESAMYINQLSTDQYKSGVLPRPGCGAGELNWDDVSERLNNTLDDRWTCITWR